MKWILLTSVFFGVTAFVLEAFIAHGLKASLGEHYDEVTKVLTTATRHQMTAALFLLVLILVYRSYPIVWVLVSQALVCVGVVCFCGSIYLKYLCGMTPVGSLAPIGGIAFMLSFLALAPMVIFF